MAHSQEGLKAGKLEGLKAQKLNGWKAWRPKCIENISFQASWHPSFNPMSDELFA
jgi:hypothetical protein